MSQHKYHTTHNQLKATKVHYSTGNQRTRSKDEDDEDDEEYSDTSSQFSLSSFGKKTVLTEGSSTTVKNGMFRNSHCILLKTD